MRLDPTSDSSEFAEFADALRRRRAHSEQIVRLAIQRATLRHPEMDLGDLEEVTREVEATLRDLDAAADELDVQSDALFAARVELDGSSALFRELFELAPFAYFLTAVDTRIIHANDAACALLHRAKNALAGKPLLDFVAPGERGAFRAALFRSVETPAVTTWPVTLLPDTRAQVDCRVRMRRAATAGSRSPRVLYWTITEETDEDFF